VTGVQTCALPIFVHRDGYQKNIIITVDIIPNTKKRVVSLMDITERKRAEEMLKNSEEKYRNIFENAVEGIFQTAIDGRFITVNAAFAHMAGYNSPKEFIESIKDIGTQLYVHSEDRKRVFTIMETKGFVKGFEVEFSRKDGNKFWVVINARKVKDEQGEILFAEGFVEDITIRKHAEEQLHQTLDMLRKAVATTVQVLISALEARDPYTAGHQSRVAHLACAIATEMGLSQEKIEGILMAGSIHDVGKLSIPAEILSKPTKLTNTEFSIIKEHSKSGYEMLKDVESPWPLAEIVYEHHERMNGSGYPRNLKGDEILMEARIMAVADVVEAIASHRPYRPSLGIETALEEIEKNKGILYDNAVVDACLKLFREKGYQLT
jgi:PAS domain S-box-containing protein